MAVTPSTERAAKAHQRRQEAGWVRLQGVWLDPAAAAALERLQRVNGLSATAAISRALLAAPKKL